MEFLNRMTEVIGYIEDNIAEDFDYNHISRIVGCDVYQFGRIFSYIVGISFSEYIRNRRLSLAALELQTAKYKVIDIALKYGYNSPESFSRAFKELHGISPKEACTQGVRLRMCPRISFYISIKGYLNMDYRIEEKGIIKGLGVVKNFGRWTANKDSEYWKEQMGERWEFWNAFLNGGVDSKIAEYGLYRAPFYQMGVINTLENGEIIEAIGVESDGKTYDDLIDFEVPASTWAVFTAMGALNQKIHPIDELTARIFTEWLPSSGYEKSMNYEIQVYKPGDTQKDYYTCEIWIPVKRK